MIIAENVYCQQLDHGYRVLCRQCPTLANRKKIVILQHDNAETHFVEEIQSKIISLGWDVLLHPPFLPDLESADFTFVSILRIFYKWQDIQNQRS